MNTPEPRDTGLPTNRRASPPEWSPPLPDAPGFEHFAVETPGLRRHVAMIGDGEPVVMLHGLPMHWWQWREIGPRLAAAGYRVICPDQRGFGWTEDDGARLEPETWLHDLLTMFDALELDRVRVVCHDMGAISAMQLAYAHPERVRATVTMAVPPGFMSFSPSLFPNFAHIPPLMRHRPGAPLDWLFDEQHIAHRLSDEMLDAYLSPYARPGLDAAIPELYRRVVMPLVLQMMRGTYKRQRLMPPNLFVFGDHDGAFTEDRLRRLCGDLSRYAEHAELAFVDDARHFVTDDQPEAVTELVVDFFDRVG
ncbi:alpha/beta fold hydrolase [Agromyces sp. NPDC058136]|uniref:alpha/beta fold hydrolase n=1 Tax=Agromyces sp. NPDC058136 TaxID=3346354 RepID=UPI0036DCEA63